MDLVLGIVTATLSLAQRAVAMAAETATKPLDVVIFANCFETKPEDYQGPNIGTVRVGFSMTNIGCTNGFHEIWKLVAPVHKDHEQSVIVYMHDDVEIYEHGWDDRIRRHFEQYPSCALGTFGGAKGLGSDRLYVDPYELHQLGRTEFLSNMTSAELHGKRTVEDQLVSTLDSFSMLCRTSFLDKINGWDWYPYPVHNIDNSIACQVKRHGFETWLIPIKCEHFGGSTSTKAVYQDWAKEAFGGDVAIHRDSHVWMYKEFRDVLPLRVAADEYL